MRSAVVLGVAAALAPSLLAQGDLRPRLAGRVPPAVAAAVSSFVDSAQARGLPTGPLVDKALEGAVKGVAPDLIVRAVGGVFQHLEAAAMALRAAGPSPGDDAVEAGAFALDAGLTTGDVREIARAADLSHPTAVALQVAGLLAALGVPRAQTVGLVRTTIQSGQPIGDLVNLPSQVQAEMARGSPPAAAAAGLERAAAAHQGPLPKGQGHGHGNPHKP